MRGAGHSPALGAAVDAREGRSPAATRTVHVLVPLLSLAAVFLLTVLVATGVTDGVDAQVRALFRPNDEWGALQIGVDGLIETFSPVRSVALLGVATAVTAVRRHSWRPALCVFLVVLTAGLLTALLKVLVGRPDTHGDVAPLGGSYPSGHVVTVLVVAGCLALLARSAPSALAWVVVALAGAVMSWALLVQTAHWFTDVLGAVLVAVLVLSLATHLPIRPGAGGSRPSSEPRGGGTWRPGQR